MPIIKPPKNNSTQKAIPKKNKNIAVPITINFKFELSFFKLN